MRILSADDKLDILLIEDSVGDAILIERCLNEALPGSHELCRVATLSEALGVLDSREFDIALLDRSLPDVDGFSGLFSLQNIAPKLPIVFLTAYHDEHTALEAIGHGAQDYLYKDKLDAHIAKRAIQYAVIRKQFESVLIIQANFDMLTGLANRMFFESRLDMALARKRRRDNNVAVLFLDLDHFKQVNDTLGHAAGDKLLQDVAKRLKSVLRPYDTAARLGGDEFAVLLEGLPEIGHCAAVARKIIEELDTSFRACKQTCNAGVSIGIATCDESQRWSSDELMQQADIAMYAAKTKPQSAYVLYEHLGQAELKIRKA